MADKTEIKAGMTVRVYGMLGKVEKVASGGKRLFVKQATRTVWVAASRAEVA